MKLFFRSILFWFLFIPIAIINGIIRTSVYQPIIGDLKGHLVSSLIFSVLFIIYSYIFVKTYKGTFEKHDLLKIGLLWVSLTIIFEFGFGHYIAGHTWKYLLADYNIFRGRVWFLVLLVIAFSPSGVKKLLK